MKSLKITSRVMLMYAVSLIMMLGFTSKLSAGYYADSVVFQNDSTFTIESVKEELGTDGEWIKVNKEDIDPGAVADQSGGFDPEINTQYIWRPYNVEPGWSPYTNGYWRYTNCGWMWVSYYDWGWRTCHYGRWWYSDYYGWVWSPGFVWAPAWVVWMYNDGYCGWYPISPWVRWHHGYGYRCHNMRYKVRCWTYVEKRKFADPIPPRVPVIDPKGITEIVKTGTVDANPHITKTGVNTNGPGVKSIEDVTGKKQPVNDVNMYNNTDKYYGSKVDDDVKKKDDDTWKNTTGTKGNDGVNDKTGVKKNDGGNNNTGNNTDTWKKTDDNSGKDKNTGTKKTDGNNGTKDNGSKDNNGSKNKDTWNGNNGNKNNDGNKQYTPPPTKQYDPPKQEQPKKDPPKQYDPPKQEQPRKDPPPKRDNDNNGKTESPPTKQNDGKK